METLKYTPRAYRSMNNATNPVIYAVYVLWYE